VQDVLAAGLSILPLAPVSDVGPEKVPNVLLAISERLIRETTPEQAAALWAATEILMGLRFSAERVEERVEGVSAMILGIRGIEESSVYQRIFAKGEAKGRAEGEAKGRAEEARQALLHLGSKRLGQPDERVRTRLDAIDDLDGLNVLLERMLDVSSWDELLAVVDPSA